MRLTVKIIVALVGFVLAMLMYTQAAQGQYIPRFHRYAMTPLDQHTFIDFVKDAATGRCYPVYVRREQPAGWREAAVGLGAATLGEVPCDPIPVPPKKGDAPPASPVR